MQIKSNFYKRIRGFIPLFPTFGFVILKAAQYETFTERMDLMSKIKIGIFGGGRGVDLAGDFMLNGCEIVALCDNNKERMASAVEKFGGQSIATYDDFDKFLEHDMDAVLLANFFHEHAPYAIKCFERGLHVYSECISNGTMAEGVELIRAHEKSNCVYMLAENYPQMIFNREIKRVCQGGTLGKILFAEGEYNHPVSAMDEAFYKRFSYFEGHWRNYVPGTYYVTHSLGPLMAATGATPARVTAFAAFNPYDGETASASHVADRAAVIMTQNDDGSVFRVTGCAGFGAHNNSYRVCGERGQIENLRGMDPKVMLRYNAWEIPEGMEEINCYEPVWNDPDEEIIKNSGHGGGDYLTIREFINCIKEGRQPGNPYDIHSAVAMSSVAILSHRSMLEGGKPYEIPDFHKEECRKQYENDRLTPFVGVNGEAPTIPCCSKTDYAPTEKQLELYREMMK